MLDKKETAKCLEGRNMALDPSIINTEDIGEVPAGEFATLTEKLRAAILGDVFEQVDLRGLNERTIRSLVGNEVADLLIGVE
ncbi:hypothetical protein GF366_01480 [Candidatus Peregrinibacteria bacterium]|nr:hypothetical protein [Candidatus Peregrinibacteria bacterium]